MISNGDGYLEGNEVAVEMSGVFADLHNKCSRCLAHSLLRAK